MITASFETLYRSECARLGHEHDAAQQQVVMLLDDLRRRLMKPTSRGRLRELLSHRQPAAPSGLYIWGRVGRGKTWLMDLFFQSLPFRDKQRSHFHRFMRDVHDELKAQALHADPLTLVAQKIARRARVLCFDELFVADIGDAMLLGTLFRELFARGVTLVATSNVPPDELYKDGLQRARFLPAIRLLQQHTEVVHLDGATDHRLRLLERADTWFDAAHGDSDDALQSLFTAIAGEPGRAAANLVLNQRRLRVHRLASKVIWFSFKELCDGPRSQADYIELARCYHTVFLSDIPALNDQLENQARRFIALVDEFYDRSVKLIVSAARPAPKLYDGARLGFEFERTTSRLIEMQSREYLARPHEP